MSRLIDADALIQSTDKESVHMYQIALAPTVDPIKHGHLIKCLNSYVCSKCEAILPDVGYRLNYCYCPKCGAKMDEVEDGKID